MAQDSCGAGGNTYIILFNNDFWYFDCMSLYRSSHVRIKYPIKNIQKWLLKNTLGFLEPHEDDGCDKDDNKDDDKRTLMVQKTTHHVWWCWTSESGLEMSAQDQKTLKHRQVQEYEMRS